MKDLDKLFKKFIRKRTFVGIFIVTVGVIFVNSTISYSLSKDTQSLDSNQSNAKSIHHPAILGTRIAIAQSVKVEIEGFQFKPNTVTVKRGSTVTFTNKDATPHTVTPAKGGKFTGTGRLQKNESKQVTFNEVGEQNYYCEIHPSMIGKVKVIN